MINLERISFAYDEENILDDLSFKIACGDFIGIIGSNGAGKTTLFDLICGSRIPKIGSIDRGIRKSEIGYCIQGATLPFRMKSKEAVRFVLGLNGIAGGYAQFLSRLSDIGQKRWERIENRIVGHLSGGESKWLAVNLILNLPMKMFILDEPTSGVDPKFREDIWHSIGLAYRSGVAVVVSSHLTDELKDNTQKIYILESGKLTEA